MFDFRQSGIYHFVTEAKIKMSEHKDEKKKKIKMKFWANLICFFLHAEGTYCNHLYFE